jgi:hypothetical protein
VDHICPTKRGGHAHHRPGGHLHVRHRPGGHGLKKDKFENKGPLISECLLGVTDFPKNPTKTLTNFCPRI